MPKYGVCITISSTKQRLYLVEDACKAWINGYELDSNCWTIDIKSPKIAKFSSLKKAEDVMLLTPLSQLKIGFPKVMRF